ncbi:MAG: universal stress protein [Corynebacterium sp.]|nr:universal stress protein [Corynebacterium sp.]
MLRALIVTPNTPCVRAVAWLADGHDVRVRTASIVVKPWLTFGASYEKWAKKEAKRQSEILKELLSHTPLLEVWDGNQLLTGDNEIELLAQATGDWEPTLIVCSASSPLLSSLLHSSTYPLLVVPDNLRLSKHGPSRVTVDFSNDVVKASALAGRLDLPLRIVAFLSEDFAAPNRLHLEMITSIREETLVKLDELRDQVGGFVSDVETVIGSGPSLTEAVQSIRWKKGDLLSVSSTRTDRVFVGATTEELIRTVSTPVVVSL